MILDLTHTIRSDMPVYPGDPQPSFRSFGTLTKDGYRATEMRLSSHTGTHMDAPSHLLQNGSSLDVLPISQFCGRAAVVDVSGLPARSEITADFLRGLNGSLLSADYVLFYTGWEKRWGSDAYFEDDFPVPDRAAAQYLVSCGLKGVGTDALSVDTLRSVERPAHKVLLGGGLVIVECLCLRKLIGRGDFMFFAMPLKFSDADGAPVRAIAELRDFSEQEERNEA